jgi:hypothetical protein
MEQVISSLNRCPELVATIENHTGINLVDALKHKRYDVINDARQKLKAWQPVAVNIFNNTPEATHLAKKITGVDVVEILNKEENADGVIQSIVFLIAIGVSLMVYGIVLGNLEAPLKDAIPDNSSFQPLEDETPTQLANAGKIASVIPIIAIAAIIIGIIYRLM